LTLFWPTNFLYLQLNSGIQQRYLVKDSARGLQGGLDHHFIKIWKREFEDIQETYQQWLRVSAAMDTFILSFWGDGLMCFSFNLCRYCIISYTMPRLSCKILCKIISCSVSYCDIVSKLVWGSGTKEIHPHTKSSLNFILKTTDRWSHNYCKKLPWWVNWFFHSEKNAASSCVISCIIDLFAGRQSTTNKLYLEFKISKTIDSWKKWHTLHNTA